MNKFIKFALVILLALGLVGCTKTDEPANTGSTEPTADAADFKVGFVTDVGGIDDKSFNQSTYEGIQRFASENGLVEGTNFSYLQSGNDKDYLPNLSTFAEEGVNLIAAAGFLFTDAIGTAAKSYPDTNFLVIDVAGLDIPNLQQANFAVNEGSFLVGVAAGNKAIENGSKHVGMIIGQESVSMNGFWAGYQQGVWAACPDCVISYDNANSFQDAAIGKTLAQKQYEAGATVIFSCAGGSGNGVIQEACERRQNGEDVWVIGVDTDQYEYGKYGDGTQSAVLTSMLKRVDVAAYNACKQVMDGTFKGGEVLYTLADEGVGLPQENPNLTEEDIAAINVFKDEIVSGKITVSNEPVYSDTSDLVK